MYSKLKISNFKSIVDIEVELGRFNVFIGENGCGKTNILEAVALLSGAKTGDLTPEELINRGVRVSKPALMTSSFLGFRVGKDISIDLDDKMKAQLYCENKDDIYSKWRDRVVELKLKEFEGLISNIPNEAQDNSSKPHSEKKIELSKIEFNKILTKLLSKLNVEPFIESSLDEFIIYSLNTNALRGIAQLSKRLPLGIYGEGFDTLIKTFSAEEKKSLGELMETIQWLEDIVIDEELELRSQKHSLGQSNSILYFTDKYMKKQKKILSAENANEGILYLLFYFTLFISKKTPKFFAIDNIETALNPKLCRDLIKQLAILAKENDKQTLITTHNPAILDGLNLNDDEQRLFVVKRSDEGYTKVERIKLKLKTKATEGLKLSELWMRGYLGGLPQPHF